MNQKELKLSLILLGFKPSNSNPDGLHWVYKHYYIVIRYDDTEGVILNIPGKINKTWYIYSKFIKELTERLKNDS